MLQAAENGNTQSQNALGIFYAKNKQINEAVKWWERAAEQNNVHAMANLGEHYFQNNNYAQALKWLLPAANNGNLSGAYKLALCYLHGLGIENNTAEALKWSVESAKGGRVDAMILTASIYDNYYNDKSNARIWFEMAADNNNAHALNWLGAEEMRTGNSDAGFQYFMKAAKLGLPEAQCNVGVAYFNNRDYDAAKIWLEKAAKQNHPKAIEILRRPEML